MNRRTLALALVVAACTSSVPAPEVVIRPIPVSLPPDDTTTAPTRPAARPPAAPPASNAPVRLPSGRSVRGVRDVGDTSIRVLLSANTATVRISSPAGLVLSSRDGSLVARVARDEGWRVERQGRRVRAVRPDGVGTVWAEPPLWARPVGSALLSVGGKPYRGDLAFYGADTGLVVVNVLKIDEYLLGVVPLEIGTRAQGDSAAVQAQAITARSYAYTRLSNDPVRMYDLSAGVLDQVYGGVEVETAVASEAVESTRTLVLKYAGRIVNAPYHSTCGGSTAAASEVWRSNDEPYLQRVSDRIPGTGRFYCDVSPRFNWTRTLEGSTLNAGLAQYLATYATVPGRQPGAARNVTITSHTTSGRVGTISISTDRGTYSLRGNDIRFVLRPPGGEILNSTYFTVETSAAADGSLRRLMLRGTGNGHGVGMCQWGAIGRAREGQDARAILRAYYPGTNVGPAQ